MSNNTKNIGDIDIDFKDRNDVLKFIEYIPAKKTDGAKHTTGVYVQDIETDPITASAEHNYDESPYTKLDFLNLSTLSHFKSNEEISELINKEPTWDLLKIPDVVKMLPHIHDYFNLIQEIDPKNVEDLMSVLDKIREHSQYKFKRAHCLSYALNIVALMNLFERDDFIPEN